jgi:molybdopterin-guanine dinucleotide biosynthesis protein A
MISAMGGPTPASLLVLAGGASRRMGSPKSLLAADVEGTITLLELVVGRLSGAFAELLIAGPPELVPPALHPHLVRDLHVGVGPLAGIEAGLAHAAHPVLFAAATDMPYLTPELAVRVVEASVAHDAAVPLVGGRLQPLAAAYRTSASGPIAAALGAGRRAVQEVLEELDVVVVEGLDPRLFANLNTPAEHRRFLDALPPTDN